MPFTQKIFADGGCQGEVMSVALIGHWELEIVKLLRNLIFSAATLF